MFLFIDWFLLICPRNCSSWSCKCWSSIRSLQLTARGFVVFYVLLSHWACICCLSVSSRIVFVAYLFLLYNYVGCLSLLVSSYISRLSIMHISSLVLLHQTRLIYLLSYMRLHETTWDYMRLHVNRVSTKPCQYIIFYILQKNAGEIYAHMS